MPLYVITYDERAKTRNYQPLYDQLNSWGAAHLQNSVWLANLKGPAATIRDLLRAHMHADDTVCVVQLPASGADWATHNARPVGVNWLRSHYG